MTKHSAPVPQSKIGRFDPLWRHQSAPDIRYASAVLLVGAALLTTDTLKESLHTGFFQTPFFFCAIVLSSWFGGFGPGIVASVLSILAIKFFFMPPFQSLAFTLGEMPRFGGFLFARGFISWLGDRQRRDEAALIHARTDLEEKVQARTVALTTTNERLTMEIAERSRVELELRRLNRAWRVRNACNQAVSLCSDELPAL